MVELEKQFIDTFRNHGGLRFEVFQLSGTENMIDWTNMAKIISANQDEEKIWVEQVFYRDSTHQDECMAKCGNDENMKRLYKQFMDVITPDPVRSWGSSAALGSR